MISGGEKSFNSGAFSRPDLDEQFIMAYQIQSRRRKQSQSLRSHVQRILQASKSFCCPCDLTIDLGR
jgi:hypothetical protein